MIYIDCETYSEEPIKNGHFKYAEKAELLMVAWAVDDGPVELWDTTKDVLPKELEHILFISNDLLIAHNASFEQAIFSKHKFFQNLAVEISPHRWHCTMAQAYAHGLPGSLEHLGAVLGLPIDRQKAKTGYDLIRLFCLPPAKNVKRPRATRLTHPQQWEVFKTYCKQDIIATREIYKKLPKWNYQGFELNLWHLDQKINQRGLNIDLDLANAAIRAVDKEQASLRKRTVDITEGQVGSTTQRDVLLRHILEAYGVELPDMQASTLERRIEDPDLPEALRELLAIRLQATTSSTAKYKRLVKSTCSDGRLRGTLQWCGASRTSRWSGRLFQPQNLPRPTFKQQEIEFGIEALKADCADIIYGNVMELASNTIRSVISAPIGKKLVVSDLSNIEGRYSAWLAGEEWKLQAFRAFDSGTGPDLYNKAYAHMFRIKPEEVSKEQRQIGKTLELSMSYAGGVNAFVTFSLNLGADLNKMSEDAKKSIPSDVYLEAEEFWDWAVKEKRTLNLEKDVFIVCDSFKRMWRRANPKITSFWKEIEEAVRNAITTPNTEFIARKVKTHRTGNWLRILMPSGRCLCYPHPQVGDKGAISFSGINQYSRQWGRIKTFGGKLTENLVQAGARDVMAHNMFVIEQSGYNIVLTCHDEVITEVCNNENFNAEKLSLLLSQDIPWACDLPLSAAGFESVVYRKE